MRYDEFVASRLLRCAVMLTGDTHLAQDLVRETMVRVQLKWRRVVAAAAAALDTVIMLDDAPGPRSGVHAKIALTGEIPAETRKTHR